jgi:hypothetical protein
MLGQSRILDGSRPRRLAGLVALTVCTFALVASRANGTQSLTLTLGANPAVGQPLSVVAEGVADGSDDLYVYATTGGCAADPYAEATETFEVLALSSAGADTPSVVGGEAVSAGDFRQSYSFTPWAPKSYDVCAYLDPQPSGPPDAAARAGFSLSGAGVVKAPYLPEASEALKRIAGEHEQQLQREREQQERERAERERIPASEQLHSEPAARNAVGTKGHSKRECIVPRLRGRSLAGARAALRHADCRLGALRRPARSGGALVVTWQGARGGSALAAGARVAIALGSVPGPATH